MQVTRHKVLNQKAAAKLELATHLETNEDRTWGPPETKSDQGVEDNPGI